MRINIELNSLEELEALKSALGVGTVELKEVIQPAPCVLQQDVQPAMPMASQVFAVPQAPVQPAPIQQPQPQPVPTTAPQYTLDDLTRAATPLMDAGKQSELVALLRSFGINTMPELKAEHYGAFALKLREMGANI